jgi:hypothetical protein
VRDTLTRDASSLLHPKTGKALNPLGLSAFQNSWGGTRTRDPGIMRASAALGKALAHCINCAGQQEDAVVRYSEYLERTVA